MPLEKRDFTKELLLLFNFYHVAGQGDARISFIRNPEQCSGRGHYIK